MDKSPDVQVTVLAWKYAEEGPIWIDGRRCLRNGTPIKSARSAEGKDVAFLPQTLW
jgi:hypothetical protein